MLERKFELEWGGKQLIVKSGKLAGQANGSCTVQYGGTVVLAAAVMSRNLREGVDFLPLLVDYEEKLYAAGKIKGSRFIKREGRATDEAILSGRLVDRAIRPLFNQDIRNDIQVTCSVLSFDQENDPDIIALIASSIALTISDIPWAGPIVCARVGLIDNEWVINTSYQASPKSALDLVVAGTEDRVIMIEGGANEVSEEKVIEAIQFSQKHFKKIIDFIREISKEISKEKDLSVLKTEKSEEEKKLKQVTTDYLNKIVEQYLFTRPVLNKTDRREAVKKISEDLDKYLETNGFGKDKRAKVLDWIDHFIKEKVGEAILLKSQRVDGRALDEIRPLECEVGILPCVHGSGLFSRGETQILSAVTLGGPGAEQFLDTMEETGKKRYFHHYNFPAFSTGEVAPSRGPGRREIGHGALAEKALIPVLPDGESFPYTIRVVSEVLSSNGSSSMGSVCGSSLSLMDAGVPIKKPVAGIAIGLVSRTNEKGEIKDYKIFTDIQDMEDSEGGMDFKVAGTVEGITAIQMDTKTFGLTGEIVGETFKAAKEARLKILEKMGSVITEPRKELSPFAPRVITYQINPEKIRDVIGPGGKMINEIIDKTGADIDIEQSGLVSITADNKEQLEKALEWVKNLTREVKVGEVFQGKVVRILDFGAFVEILPKQDGLVHISELAPQRVRKVEDVVNIGDIVTVKVIKIDEQGRINLSLKGVRQE